MDPSHHSSSGRGGGEEGGGERRGGGGGRGGGEEGGGEGGGGREAYVDQRTKITTYMTLYIHSLPHTHTHSHTHTHINDSSEIFDIILLRGNQFFIDELSVLQDPGISFCIQIVASGPLTGGCGGEGAAVGGHVGLIVVTVLRDLIFNEEVTQQLQIYMYHNVEREHTYCVM